MQHFNFKEVSKESQKLFKEVRPLFFQGLFKGNVISASYFVTKATTAIVPHNYHSVVADFPSDDDDDDDDDVGNQLF